MDSSLHATVPPHPSLILFRKTMGVFPISSVTLSAMFNPVAGGESLTAFTGVTKFFFCWFGAWVVLLAELAEVT